MRLNAALFFATFFLTFAVTGGPLPATLTFLATLFLTTGLIFLLARLSVSRSLLWVAALVVTAGWNGKGWMAAAVYSMLTLFPAAAAGIMTGKKLPYKKLLAAISLVAILPSILFVLFAYPGFKLDILSKADLFKNQLMAGAQLVGQAPLQIEEMRKSFDQLIQFVVRVAPALYYIAMFFSLTLAHLLAIWMLGKAGVSLPGPKNFLAWQAPFFFTLLLALGLAGHLFLRNEWIKAADNLLLVVVFVYAACGASNLQYFFKKMSAHWAIKGLFYIWLVIFGIASFFVLSAVGFLDSRFDFRRLKASIAKESEE